MMHTPSIRFPFLAFLACFAIGALRNVFWKDHPEAADMIGRLTAYLAWYLLGKMVERNRRIQDATRYHEHLIQMYRLTQGIVERTIVSIELEPKGPKP